MPDKTNPTFANAPKDTAAGKVKPSPSPRDRSGKEAKDTATLRDENKEGEHADHATEEAAAYRENDA